MSTAASEQPQLDDYWAVVLYAPEETVWCSWIHRQLDGILVPEAMVGRPTRHGFPLPAALSVFPNPEDPGKVSAYAEAVRKARYLIVVCSPASADAESVEQQIRAFKRTGGEGGEERIVVLLVERELDEASNTSTGKAGDDWLPPWLSWRAGPDGSLRQEAGEPMVIDARPGRLSLDDARGSLMSVLMDFGRTDKTPRSSAIFKKTPPAYEEATPTQIAAPVAAARQSAATTRPSVILPKMEPITPVAVPSDSTKKGAPILAIAAVAAVLALGFAIWMWMKPPAPSNEPVSVSQVSAASTAPSDPQSTAIVPPATPEPQPIAVAPEPIATIPTPVVPSPTQVPPSPPETERPGAVTSISPAIKSRTELASPVGAVSGDAALDRWRKLRELGDTLIERENRDAGIIALAQAAEAADMYVQTPKVSATIRIEAARLCFRLGALQRQYGSKGDASKTMARARRILDRTKATGDEATERKQLIENIDTFLAGMKE